MLKEELKRFLDKRILVRSVYGIYEGTLLKADKDFISLVLVDVGKDKVEEVIIKTKYIVTITYNVVKPKESQNSATSERKEKSDKQK